MVLESWGDGGTEAYVDQLGGWLWRHGVRPAVCVLGGVSGAFERVAATWTESAWVLQRRNGASRASTLSGLVRRYRPSVCHLHLYSSLLPAAVAVRACSSARLVTTLHMPLWQWHWRHRLAWRTALRLSHAVTANSRAVLRSVGRCPPMGNTWLTPAPLHRDLIDGTIASAVPAEGPDRPFVVVGAGRLAPEKDWPTLFRAFALFRAEGRSQVRLKLFGSGPLEADLRALAGGLGIAHVLELPGSVPRERLFAELRRADVFVLPSRFEGLGMAAIEAMALGVPTITADFEASEEYIEDGATGWRFPRGDAEALAKLLRTQCAYPLRGHAVAERGQRLVREQFAEDAVFGPFLDAYAGGVTAVGNRHPLLG